MKVAIIGYELEGRSAVKYWQAKGADITICKRSPKEVPAGVATQFGADYLKDLDRFDVIMRSAGIHPNIILEQNPSVKDKITTTVDEFLRVCPTKNIIGITGTKGKGTTSMLTVKMLEASGKKVFLGGNFGISPFDFLSEVSEDSWVVLELSSFMLYDIKRSPHIAVCLMVVPEHLDWHVDEADYYNAKANLFRHQTTNDVAVYFAENPVTTEIASHSPGTKIGYYSESGAHVQDGKIVIGQTEICNTSEIKLLGSHNWQNACAAATTLWQIEQNPEPIRQVLTTFTGLEYRLEFVREVDGVKYYNDSFGTTPETAMVAIEAFKQPVVAIVGGSQKGTPFDELAHTIAANNVRQVILIGNTTHPRYEPSAPLIEAALHQQGFQAITSLVKPGGSTMTEIVEAARGAAQPGDIVLLSTGSASFDMFTDYKDRGNQYKEAVNAL